LSAQIGALGAVHRGVIGQALLAGVLAPAVLVPPTTATVLALAMITLALASAFARVLRGAAAKTLGSC